MESSQRNIPQGGASVSPTAGVRGVGVDRMTMGDVFTDILVAAFAKPSASAHGEDSRVSGRSGAKGAGSSYHHSQRISHRRAVAVVMMGVAVVAAVVSVMVPQRAQSASNGVEVASSVVQSGDTWWSYAESLTPQGGDVSVTVDRLMALNHDDDPTLTPGETIVLPVDSESW